jgi:hypothetical protein
MNAKAVMTLIALFLSGLMAGCTATQQGAVAGGAIGAGTGAIIGHQSGHGGEGALIGAGIGALSGALIGRGMDKSREQPPAYRSGGGYYSGREYDGDEYSAEGRRWVPEHYEYLTCTAPDGSTYQKEILVPGHYE